MDYSDLEQLVAARSLWGYSDGCPIGPNSQTLAEETAAVARRRWNSYERRNANIADTMKNRINDLARGLATKFERGGWPMVGPLISDYTWLEEIAPILVGDT